MTTLHAGGKFGGKAYETSGGLHGVGVSVVNALSERMEVEVARDRTLYKRAFERGKPTGKLQGHGRGTTGAAPSSASSPIRRFSARRRISARARFIAWRARRPICSAAWRSAGRATRR